MKVLKTIVATAVIVFAMTSVAMAGVQQLTKAQDAQALDKTPAQNAVTLTDKQLAQLIDHQSRSHVREAQRAKTHARCVHRKHAQAQQGAHEAEAQHVERVRQSAQSDHNGSASNPGVHEHETGQQTHETSQQTHVSTGGHDSGHDGGHGGD